MEKFYFESPNIERKKDLEDYIDEHIKYNSDINGIGSLDKIIYDKISYEELLKELELRKDKNYAYSINRCPSVTYFLIRENDNKLVGAINIRYDLTEEMLKFGGHIGYGIRPTERNKGYNKINLYLGLLVAIDLGLERVMLDCAIDNIASNKTIVSLGGVLERCEIDPNDNTLTNVYWIDVKKSCLKYKDVYSKYISEKFSGVES